MEVIPVMELLVEQKVLQQVPAYPFLVLVFLM
jgi:hypothetical protein